MNCHARQKILLRFHDALSGLYGHLDCPLIYRTPHELLVAAILSAQCTDVRVNAITAELFQLYPDPRAFAAAAQEELEKAIRSAGLFRAKAANIRRSSREIVEKFNGQVPRTMDELTSLSGVGRKTANVILGNAFGIPGFPVDTHVIRVLNRLGAVSGRNPVKIEQEVTGLVPEKLWTNFSHLIITHGRRTCTAHKPDCAGCAANSFCKFYTEQREQ